MSEQTLGDRIASAFMVGMASAAGVWLLSAALGHTIFPLLGAILAAELDDAFLG